MRAIPWLVVVTCTLPGVAHATGTTASTTEGRLVTRDRDVPLEHTDVHVRIDGYLADATVTQQLRKRRPTTKSRRSTCSRCPTTPP